MSNKAAVGQLFVKICALLNHSRQIPVWRVLKSHFKLKSINPYISFIDKTSYFVYYITSRSLYLQNLGEEEHNFADVNNIISELCGILERNMWRLR